MKNTVCVVVVYNVDLPKAEFDQLCDELSEKRRWCHDYRTISDYPVEEKGFWESNSYINRNSDILKACREDVEFFSDKYLKKIGKPKNSIKITIQIREVEK